MTIMKAEDRLVLDLLDGGPITYGQAADKARYEYAETHADADTTAALDRLRRVPGLVTATWIAEVGDYEVRLTPEGKAAVPHLLSV